MVLVRGVAPRPNILPHLIELIPAIELLGGEKVEAASTTAGEHLPLPDLQPVLEDITEDSS